MPEGKPKQSVTNQTKQHTRKCTDGIRVLRDAVCLIILYKFFEAVQPRICNQLMPSDRRMYAVTEPVRCRCKIAGLIKLFLKPDKTSVEFFGKFFYCIGPEWDFLAEDIPVFFRSGCPENKRLKQQKFDIWESGNGIRQQHPIHTLKAFCINAVRDLTEFMPDIIDAD